MRSPNTTPIGAGYGEAALVRAAEAGIRAPSMHNAQPWLFGLRDGAIEIRVDPGRGGWAARMACGAAACNARLALAVAGQRALVALHPDPADRDLVARLMPGRPRPATSAETALHAAIARRYSNRDPFRPAPVPAGMRAALKEAARSEGAWLDLLVGTTAIAAFSEIARSAGRVLQRDAPLPGTPEELPGRLFVSHEPEPLLGVLGVSGDRAVDQIAAGLAMQKVLLTATAAGLDTSMISQPIEVPAAGALLRRALGRSGHPQMVLRFGYGTPGRPGPRRDVTDVLI
ncbi:nitroreductase [Actinoplanes tereljensis]|uniref:Nitroreductase domain-containing protein n=1 Tax=Paractinoplanes tereljensis TaxID=571912 RepID=A0A919NR63_9ACTN|nr:nitroreductase family protein [Actinoplanes tereljensis]GIF22556.1 hypothetical protein Ate02nite_52860 [Actinoplanes tereljensis]